MPLPLPPNDPLFYAALFIFGACMGSFLHLVAWRLPGMLEHDWRAQCRALLGDERIPPEDKPPGLISPPSHCPACKTKLKFWQNLPLIGYPLTRGRCPVCRMKIPLSFLLGEWATALGFVGLGVLFGWSGELAAALVLFNALVVLTLIDLKHHLLPDAITLPLLWAGLLINTQGTFTTPDSAIYGAVLGYAGPWLVMTVHHLVTRRQGMGHGDFKLLAAVGAYLGWQALILVVLLASLGGCIAAVAIALGRGIPVRDMPLPFGPCIAAATLFALVFGDALIGVYLDQFN